MRFSGATRPAWVALVLALSACTHADNSPVRPHEVVIDVIADPFVPAETYYELRWVTDHADNCTAFGDWSGPRPTSGTETVYISAGTHSYSLDCTNETGGRARDGERIEGSYPEIRSLTAEDPTVAAGGSVKLTWLTSYVHECTASGAWSGSKPITGFESVTVPAVGPNEFKLTCTDGLRSAEKSVTVTGAAPIVSFATFPPNPVVGKPVTLYWTSQYATGCSASGDWSGAKAPAGHQTLATTAAGTRNFRLDCANSVTSVRADAAATAAAAPAFPPATTYRMTETQDGVAVTTDGSDHPVLSTPAWSRDLGNPVSYPLIAGGRVFVTTRMATTPYNTLLYALSQTTGATLWGPVTFQSSRTVPAISYENGRIFVGSSSGVKAFSAADGSLLWGPSKSAYFLNAYGGVVFFVEHYSFGALDAATGAVLWNRTNEVFAGAPAVSSERVYFFHGYNCEMYAYEPLGGALIWKSDYGCAGGDSATTPALAAGKAWGPGPSLVPFDAATGAVQPGIASDGAPSITGTMLLSRAEGAATLVGRRLSDYATVWSFTGDGKLVGDPVVVNGTAFIGSSGGNVYGVDVGTGAQTWVGTAPGPVTTAVECCEANPRAAAAAGENLLVFPSGNVVVAWKFL